MSIKLAVKISDGGGVAYVGGSADEWTHVVEIKDEKLEKILRPFIEGKAIYRSCSISLVREEGKE